METMNTRGEKIVFDPKYTFSSFSYFYNLISNSCQVNQFQTYFSFRSFESCCSTSVCLFLCLCCFSFSLAVPGYFIEFTWRKFISFHRYIVHIICDLWLITIRKISLLWCAVYRMPDRFVHWTNEYNRSIKIVESFNMMIFLQPFLLYFMSILCVWMVTE